MTENFASGGSLSLATANRDASGNLVGDLSELDAAVTIDGITVTRSTNEIADAIDGVSLSLGKADPGQPTTLTVGVDRDGISSAIAGFVQSYNALVRYPESRLRLSEGKALASRPCSVTR